MARKKKAVAGVIGDTTYYFNEKGQIVDETGQPAPPAFAKAIAASGVEPPKQEEKPQKPARQRRQAPAKTPNEVVREQVARQEEAVKESKPVETAEQKKSRLGRLIERVSGAGRGNEPSQARTSADNVRESQPVGSRFGSFLSRTTGSVARGSKNLASGVLSTEYMGLGFVPGIIENFLSGGKGDKPARTTSAGQQRAAKALSTFSGTTSGMESKKEGSVSVLSKLLDASEKQNEKLDDIVKALDRQNTSRIEDSREIKQQNEQIIRLLQAIASQGGMARGGPGAGGGGLGLGALGLGGLLSSLLGGGRTLLKAGATGLKIAASAAKLGVKGTIGAAKLLGRGAVAGAGLAAGGIKSLFSGGAGTAAKEAGEAVAETGAKAAGKAAAETGAEAAAKGTAKAAEKIIAKEGTEAAAETGAKAAGKGGLKAIVAKVIGPRVGKVVAKSVPFVGALAGLGFGIARAMEGDFKGAAAEVAGGTASIFPGVGTAASIATDVGLLARDVYKEAYGIFPEDDPKSSERLEEVKKEVMNYIDENVKGKQSESSVPGPTPSGSSGTPAGATPGGTTPGATVPQGTAPAGQGTTVPVSQVAPSLNTAAGFNQGSMQMALNTNAPAPPMIVNNNNITNSASAGGGGGGGAPGRTSGPAPTAPVQSHIDRALYGDLYGAGIP